MAFSGLIALLDDIATIADDVATLTVAATKKTTGIVTDDMAVTAEQTIGIKREREIPVVLAVAKGSIRNKALILAPGALLLNAVAPWSIHPILMAGGTFLCFEGVEKLIHKFRPHPEEPDVEKPLVEMDPEALEKERVSGAIRTDLILSGEIIAITLGEVAKATFLTQAAVLYTVSVVLTVGVYGLVAGLIKIDDVGEMLARRGGGSAPVGRAIVRAAPKLLHLISWIGTVAMLVVGGHILLEGIGPLEHFVHGLVEGLPPVVAPIASILADIATGAVAGLVVVGVLATGVLQRLWKLVPKPGRKKAEE